ncbi:uncharacterized protein LOC105421067 [Amborella trichopoda]|uniref:uncharacterized protein LOC105421067 n=1 Tax=Amborella trichopoda TaxID=13333 RepID=UPI0005D2E336|nr:uncharacterized protein LOC105421067 [Amborella trichopoda]|eukprot:XP_011625346.1 uncharacterized protein LOC105421067 [Amborella trichopoda]
MGHLFRSVNSTFLALIPKRAVIAEIADVRPDKILTVDNLIKKGKILLKVCLLCKNDGETGLHLLIQYSFTTRLWYWLFEMVGVQMPLPQRIDDLVTSLKAPFLPKIGRVVWKITVVTILWEIRKEMNKRTFEGVVYSFDRILHICKWSIWSWLSVKREGWGISKVDVMANLQNLFFLGSVKSRRRSIWIAPFQGSLKLIFDRSSLGNPGLTGIGGLLRDCFGNVIFSYVGPIGSATANFIKLSALLCGLKIFSSKNTGISCTIEGDSLNVIKWCKKE